VLGIFEAGQRSSSLVHSVVEVRSAVGHGAASASEEP